MTKRKSRGQASEEGTPFIIGAAEPRVLAGPSEEPPLPEPNSLSLPLPKTPPLPKTSQSKTPPPPKTIQRNHRFCEPQVEWFQDCEPGYYLITFTWQQGMTVTQTIRAYYDGQHAHY